MTRGGVANAVAAVVASIAGLAIVLLAGRSMTPAEYASFAAVWGLVFGCAAILGALEPEVARVRSLVPGRIDGTQLAVTGVVTIGAVAGTALTVAILFDKLHLGSGMVAALVVASAAVFPALFTARGYLAGSLDFIGLACVTAGEALVRLIVVLVGLWAGFAAIPTFAVAASCGAFVALPVLMQHTTLAWDAVRIGTSLRRTATLMAGNAMSAVLLTGAPVLVGLAMAAAAVDDVGQMQAAVVVSRFPLLALMLLQSLLVPVFVRRKALYVGDDYARIVTVLACAIPLAAVASYVAGPWFLSFLYGSDYKIGPLQISLLTSGATALGGIQVLIALAVSGDRHRLSPIAFAATLAFTISLSFVPVVPLTVRIPVAMAVGPLAGFVVAVVSTMLWRRQERGRAEAQLPPTRGSRRP